jgi:hypothetical protein
MGTIERLRGRLDLRHREGTPHALTSIHRRLNGDSRMKTNEGTVDRIVRVTAGLVLLALTLTGTIGAWGYIGVIPLVTGAIGMCPLYSLMGINTCRLGRD